MTAADLRRPSRPRLALVMAIVIALLGLPTAQVAGQDGDVRLRVAASPPLTWDPAAAGDSSSANVLMQVFEGVTALDPEGNIQPALADSWQVGDDGRSLSFRLRAGVTYSDGTPIGAQDVVDSWLRLLDPAHPGPLASLLDDVEGAIGYRTGQLDREAVGIFADGDHVVVRMRRPSTYLLAVTASPSLAVVPPHAAAEVGLNPPTVVSGAYLPTVLPDGNIRLTANDRYWAGPPPLATIELVTDFGGRSGVTVFEQGEVDYTPIGRLDASWIRYDPVLGPQLRRNESLALSYYGFNTTAPPFDDARVRLAFARAVDWDRIVRLGSPLPAATSMLPPGIPGRDQTDYRPGHDPAAARALLADAGYPDGRGFPQVRLESYGVGYESAVATELEAVLGVEVEVEFRDFQDYITRLDGPDPPLFWTLSWIADYPHPHGFLGLLLESGSSSNAGRFNNSDYDAAIERAAAETDPAEQARHYGAAQQILRDEAPVVPVDYGEGWALSREGLLGASPSGVGLMRFAGLDWAPGSGR